MKRVLLNKAQIHAKFVHPDHPKAAGGFDYPATQVGTSKWIGQDGAGIGVWYDPSLGANGQAMAQNVLSRIDDLMAYCDQVFGVKGKSGNVIIAPLSSGSDGSGGAYHYGCSFNADAAGSDWYEDMATGQPDEVFGLVMAEVSESYMGLANKGWNCGGSGGEGLSRFLAEVVSGGPAGAMSGYAAGPSWDGTDWISKDQGTDGDYPSIGCSILYIWWMVKQGFTPAQIVQAGEPDGSLATNYAALTGKPATQAFADFKAAVALVGGPGGFQSDNPFGATTPPYPLGTPVPPPVPPPGPPVPPIPPVPPVPPTPPVPPLQFTIQVPEQPVVGHLLTGFHVPAFTATGVIGSGLHAVTIPPWLLRVLKLFCAGVIVLPPPWSVILAALCAALPADVPPAGHTITLPPWLLALLQSLCSNAGKLPQPEQGIALFLCSLLPPTAAGKCAGCK